MATTTVFGLPSSGFVYTIASASLIEIIVFITLYARIIGDINAHSYSVGWINPSQQLMVNAAARSISIFSIVLNSLRCMSAIAALIGQYMETIGQLAVFLVFTSIGMLANIGIGVVGMQNYWTSSVATGTVAVTGLHIVYLVIGGYIFRMKNKKMLADLPTIPIVPGHVPYAIPVQTTISVLPTAISPQVMPGQQHFHNPNMTPAPDVFYPNMPPPPPSYDESNSSGAVPEFPPKN